jgi:hypothetical protein
MSNLGEQFDPFHDYEDISFKPRGQGWGGLESGSARQTPEGRWMPVLKALAVGELSVEGLSIPVSGRASQQHHTGESNDLDRFEFRPFHELGQGLVDPYTGHSLHEPPLMHVNIDRFPEGDERQLSLPMHSGITTWGEFDAGSPSRRTGRSWSEFPLRNPDMERGSSGRSFVGESGSPTGHIVNKWGPYQVDEHGIISRGVTHQSMSIAEALTAQHKFFSDEAQKYRETVMNNPRGIHPNV